MSIHCKYFKKYGAQSRYHLIIRVETFHCCSCHLLFYHSKNPIGTITFKLFKFCRWYAKIPCLVRATCKLPSKTSEFNRVLCKIFKTFCALNYPKAVRMMYGMYLRFACEKHCVNNISVRTVSLYRSSLMRLIMYWL